VKKLKLLTIIGTRPEIIRLSEVIRACDTHFEHTLVHTGQNWDYTLNEIFFDDLNLRSPDYYLGIVGSHLGETMGNIICKSYSLLEKTKPDAVLILGDTNSTLSAISAKRLKIPIFHMEAGNRCFDQNVPEEINRKIVDHISDVNLAYTEHSRRYLLSEGIAGRYIFVTGSPMAEILSSHMDKICKSKILDTLTLIPKKYIVVSAHREENIDNEKHFLSLMTTLNEIAELYKFPVIYSVHPRSRNHIEKHQFIFHPLVRKIEPLNFTDYIQLQKNAYCVLSDSGTLSEESAIVNFPSVLIRTSTERPEVLDSGTIIVGGIESNGILQSIEMATSIAVIDNFEVTVKDYSDLHVSLKVVKLIQSYTKIINDYIWGK
jgi:UDP-N-acetyl-L-fucosamine synthase